MVSSLCLFARQMLTSATDTVIWLGDFNYRIGLGSEKVKKYIQMGDLDALYENDQVCLAPKGVDLLN